MSPVCQNCKEKFEITQEDLNFYKKIEVPPPTWCPECRMMRRMMWRNESSLYKRACGMCGKSIITIYAPESPFVVYCKDCWASDNWDPVSYGKDYNKDTSFFTQFRALLETVPLVVADRKGTMENSEYGNYNGNCKNCYLCFSTALSEDSMYCTNSQELKQCIDSLGLRNGELCYEAVDCEKNYRCVFVDRTRESADSSFLFGCSNAIDCFMSANLRNKSNVFRGEQLNQEEYAKRIRSIDFGDFETLEKLKREFEKMKAAALHKNAEIKNSVEATGDNITNSKNVVNSFDVNDSENIKHSLRILKGCRDVYDCHGMVNGELVCEGFGCGFSPRHNLFSFSVDVSSDLTYCAMCHDCSNCFGCVALKNKQYCILNKQYTKEEYEKLVSEIVTRMNEAPYTDKKGRVYKYGEFFPVEFSPFAYNETIAQDQFPLSKSLALEKGYSWKDTEKKGHTATLKTEEIPERIADVDDSILGEVLQCAHDQSCDERCSGAFKITPQELLLYKKLSLPLPRLCPSCRYFTRLKRRNPLKLWKRGCNCAGKKSENGAYQNTATHFHGDKPCPNEFETSYAPDRPEVVYCEACYQSEIV